MFEATFTLQGGVRVTVTGSREQVDELTRSHTVTSETMHPPDGSSGARATLTLPNGTWVAIEGPLKEITALVNHYGQPLPPQQPHAEIDTAWLAEKALTCEEAAAIRVMVLNHRNQLNRVMTVLYMAHRYISPQTALTAKEISAVLRVLRAPIAQTNISRVFRTSGEVYVIRDESGRAARFRLNNEGVRYIRGIIAIKPLL